MNKALTVTALALWSLQTGAGDAVQGDANDGKYQPAKGFHFYDLPDELRKEIQKEIETQVEKRVKEELKKREPPRPAVGSSQWLKENLPRFRQMAADNATAENIRGLLLAEKQLMDRGERLARRARLIAQSDPILDTSYKSPANQALSRARRVAADQNKKTLVKSLVEDGLSLIVFFQGDCSLCSDQVNVLNRFSKATKIPILFVFPHEDYSRFIDEPPKGVNWEYIVEPGRFKQFDVFTDISTYALHGTKKEYSLLAQSLSTRDVLEENIILAADYSSWATPDEVEATRFTRNNFDLSTISFDGVSHESLSDPSEYAKYIYEQLRK